MSAASTEITSWNSQAGAAWNRFWFAPRDPHALALLRIAVGLMWLYALTTLTPDLLRFFGRGGLLPADVIATLQEPAAGDDGEFVFPNTQVSVLSQLAEPWQLYTFHGVALAAAALFAVGFYSRAAGIASLFALLSYTHRGPVIMTPLESVLAFLFLYLCWAPCGAALSIDAKRALAAIAVKPAAPRPGQPSVAANLAVRLIQVHLVIVYLSMAFAKLNDGAGDAGEYHAWWMGEAVWWLGARPHSPLVDLTGVLASSVVTNMWTLAILAFELSFPVLIWNRLARPVMLVAAVPIWLSLALISGYAPFCLMMLAVNVVFIEADTLRRWLPAKSASLAPGGSPGAN